MTRLRAFRLLTALAGLLAAASLHAQGPAEKASLKVGIIPISNLVPLYTAQKLGYFKEEGLTVETTIATGGPALTGALIGGSLDFIYSNYVSVIQASTQGFALSIVAHQNSAQDSAPDASVLAVRNDGSVNRAADLAGKSIAVNALNNINHIAARYYLEKNGVPADKVKFVEVPFPNMGDALTKGQVDAVALVEPFVTFLKQTGKAKELAYPFIEVYPGLDIAGFIAARKFVQQNPNTVERFARALHRANNTLNDNVARKIELTAEYTKSKPELIRQLKLDRWEATLHPKSLQILSDLTFKYGLQKTAYKVDDLIYKTARK